MTRSIYGFSPQYMSPTMDNGGHIYEHTAYSLHNVCFLMAAKRKIRSEKDFLFTKQQNFRPAQVEITSRRENKQI